MNAKSGAAAAEGGGRISGDGVADAERLYRKYGPMVTRRCRYMLGSEEEAADAAQDVFVKLLGSSELLAAEYPSSLLWRMATNLCLNLLKQRARRNEWTDAEMLLSTIACLDGDNDIEARIDGRGILGRLFRRHPKSSRLIAVLHLVDGMTLEETAREAGMSVSGVKKRLRSLREDLRELANI